MTTPVDEHEHDNGLTFEVVEEEHAEGGRRVRNRGIYLLPNLFTTAALFSGFYAIIAGMQGRFEAAAIAILVAAVFDGIDGRVARLTNTQSAFGAEYDSLSDMVAFGVAPALVVFSWSLQTLGKLGWLAAFIYTAAAAFRLARFNTQIGIADKRFFTGVPSPLAAAIIAGMVWAGWDNQIVGSNPWIAWAVAAITVLTAFLMVSNFRYPSFKEFDRSRVPFYLLLIVVLVIALVSYDPPKVLFGIAVAYALSGPLATITRRRPESKPMS